MANIDIDHWAAYLTMLQEVEDASRVPIHFENVRDLLWIKSSGTYSHEFPVVGCAALADPEMLERANDSGMILVACTAGFPQPKRSGFPAPTLALKIVNTRVKEGDEYVFPLHYDLFASGRRVLEMNGLRLDNDARYGQFRSAAFQATVRALAAAIPEYHRLVTALVDTFPDSHDSRVATHKFHALSELVSA